MSTVTHTAWPSYHWHWHHWHWQGHHQDHYQWLKLKGGHHGIGEFKLLKAGEEKGDLISLKILTMINILWSSLSSCDGHHDNDWHYGNHCHDDMINIMTIMAMINIMTIMIMTMINMIVTTLRKGAIWMGRSGSSNGKILALGASRWWEELI